MSAGFHAFSYRDFRLFSATRFLFTFSVQMAETILSWKAYAVTGDPLALGLIGLSEALPFIVSIFFAGYVADRYNRKWLTVVSMGFLFLCFLAIGVLLPGLKANQINYLYFFIGLSGIARGFLSPAMQSILPNIIPREHYPNAAVWNSNVWQSAAVAGPAAGGLLYAGFGGDFSYHLALLIMACAVPLFGFLKVKGDPDASAIAQENLLQALPGGLKFVFEKKIIFGALLLDLLAVLFGGAMALLPVFAKDILHAGPELLGIMRAAPFLGSVSMGLILAFYPPLKRSGELLLISVFCFGLCWLGFALSEHVWISLLMLFLTGWFDNISVVIRHTIVQMNTPDHMRGRVSAVNSIFISSSNEIGAFESGFAARFLGTVPSVVLGSVITLLSVGWIRAIFPELRKYEMRERS
jgi:MFS family permease